MSGLLKSLSLSPHCAHIISFLGNGLSSEESEHVTEQVAHWKHFLSESPPLLMISLTNLLSGLMTC
jgi:uncharacterized membrane protein